MEQTKEFFIDCDGTRLHAKLDRPGTDRGPLCILVHGFTGHMEENHILAARDAMIDAGVSVLRVEMYGHGQSDGEFRYHTMYKWVTNALAAVKYAKSLDFVTDLYFCGHSQGGLLTMLIGGMCVGEIKAILPLSPAWMIPEGARTGHLLGMEFDPVHIPETLSGWGRKLDGDYVRVAQTIHVEDEIARFDGPVLIVHGTEDDAVPFSYAEKAHELYKNSTLVPVEGDGHCFTQHLDVMKDAIRTFYAKELHTP
jgi:pimeloyl-ACP methyl ester carboxylesterase